MRHFLGKQQQRSAAQTGDFDTLFIKESSVTSHFLGFFCWTVSNLYKGEVIVYEGCHIPILHQVGEVLLIFMEGENAKLKSVNCEWFACRDA